jgi:hypothetical protein
MQILLSDIEFTSRMWMEGVEVGYGDTFGSNKEINEWKCRL